MISITFFVIATPKDSYTQAKSSGIEISAGLAGFVYQGDLAPGRIGSLKTTRPGFVLSAGKITSRSFLIRVNASISGLRGDETKYENPEYRKFRAFKFRTPLIEISPQLVWNPLGKNYSAKGFSPYVFGGVGITFLKIRKDYSGYDAEYFGDGSDIPARLALDNEQSLPGLRIIIPAGAGVRYNLSERFALNLESAYRFPFTDYLDGFSRAANPDRKDHYHSTMIGAIYRFGNKNTLACPVIKY